MISSFQFFSFPYGDIAKKNSNFKNEITISIFHGIFQFFSFPLVVWPNSFKFQNRLFSIFHFPLVVWAIFFQNSKTKNFNSNFKNNFLFQNFLEA
jgi:hypothetical protein